MVLTISARRAGELQRRLDVFDDLTRLRLDAARNDRAIGSDGHLSGNKDEVPRAHRGRKRHMRGAEVLLRHGVTSKTI